MDARVKLGPANLHTSTNIQLRIKALVITTFAETPVTRIKYGAIPLILISAGNTANRLMLQLKKRKNWNRIRKWNKESRTSPEKERTTEENRPRPEVDARVKHGPASLLTNTKLHLKTIQTKALVVTTIAETPMASHQSGAIPLILESAGINAIRLMQLTKRNQKWRNKIASQCVG